LFYLHFHWVLHLFHFILQPHRNSIMFFAPNETYFTIKKYEFNWINNMWNEMISKTSSSVLQVLEKNKIFLNIIIKIYERNNINRHEWEFLLMSRSCHREDSWKKQIFMLEYSKILIIPMIFIRAGKNMCGWIKHSNFLDSFCASCTKWYNYRKCPAQNDQPPWHDIWVLENNKNEKLWWEAICSFWYMWNINLSW